MKKKALIGLLAVLVSFVFIASLYAEVKQIKYPGNCNTTRKQVSFTFRAHNLVIAAFNASTTDADRAKYKNIMKYVTLPAIESLRGKMITEKAFNPSENALQKIGDAWEMNFPGPPNNVPSAKMTFAVELRDKVKPDRDKYEGAGQVIAGVKRLCYSDDTWDADIDVDNLTD
jgi:hypothetical protein